MTFGGSTGGGVLGPAPGSEAVPFGRQARLTAMCESLRAENWDVTGSLTRAVTPEGNLPETQQVPEAEGGDDADH
jgi:hypothetical protein